MAKSRIVNTRFWVDDYVSNLDPVEKLLFLYFLTNPATDISGVYEIPLKTIAVDTGIDKETVLKLLRRFSKQDKIYYKDGWIGVVNFTKHQSSNPKIMEGIRIGLTKAPKDLVARMKIDYGYSIDSPSHSNSNLNTNSNPKVGDENVTFSFEKELEKMRQSIRKDYKTIALYWKKKDWHFENKEQFNAALIRELKPAKTLKGYTGDQISKVMDYCNENYPVWTLETVHTRITDLVNKK